MTETALIYGSTEFEELGQKVSLSGDTLVAQSGSQSFAVPQVIKVYQAPGGDWTKVKQPVAVLSGSDANGIDLGFHLVVSGDTVAATSGMHNAIYVFAKPAAGWSDMTETAQLDASGSFTDQPSGGIGFQLAMDGANIITTTGGFSYGAGKAAGRILLYTQPGGGWANTHTPTAVLTVDDAHSAVADQIAIAGTGVYASAGEPPCGFNVACAHIFIFDMPGGGWVDAAPDDGTDLQPAPFTGVDTVGDLVAADGVIGLVAANIAACRWSWLSTPIPAVVCWRWTTTVQWQPPTSA